MNPARPEYPQVAGKTYSLFGQSDSTSVYYKTIRELADRVVAMHPDTMKLLDELEGFSKRKKRLTHALKHKNDAYRMHEILNLIDPPLRKYTENTEQHLKKLPLTKIWDRRLATSREQYHLYMLEIELTNRLFREEFSKAPDKIALLPYCLQDFSVNCKSEKAGFDYQCRHCSARCFQNHASIILKANNIEPFIWSGSNMKKLAGHTPEEKRTFGVLGIACIPELTFGMRSCRSKGIPVVGIPLNANRCIRWFGEFFPNSLDLDELERLVTGDLVV
jgi:hypothetical protein